MKQIVEEKPDDPDGEERSNSGIKVALNDSDGEQKIGDEKGELIQ